MYDQADIIVCVHPPAAADVRLLRPGQVLVIGAGVAGLQAIAMARRLGGVVTGYDVRKAARSDVASTGASFLDLDTTVSATGDGGYARALTEEERNAQQAALNAAIGRFDIVITTAQVPGKRRCRPCLGTPVNDVPRHGSVGLTGFEPATT